MHTAFSPVIVRIVKFQTAAQREAIKQLYAVYSRAAVLSNLVLPTLLLNFVLTSFHALHYRSLSSTFEFRGNLKIVTQIIFPTSQLVIKSQNHKWSVGNIY